MRWEGPGPVGVQQGPWSLEYAMIASTLFAKRITLEESEVARVHDLEHLAIRKPIPTALTPEALGLGERGVVTYRKS